MEYVGLIALVLLSIVGLFIKPVRTKIPKLSKVLSWIVIILFACLYLYVSGDLMRDSDILRMYTYIFVPYNGMLPFILGELLILLVINIISIDNKGKAVVLSLSQMAISMLSVLIIGIAIFVFAFGAGTGKGDKVKNLVKRNSYTEQEDIYAKANGFYDAETANANGFKTAEANQPGFDFTKKREY